MGQLENTFDIILNIINVNIKFLCQQLRTCSKNKVGNVKYTLYIT